MRRRAPRSETLTFRMSNEEIAVLRERAGDLPLSQYIRGRLFDTPVNLPCAYCPDPITTRDYKSWTETRIRHAHEACIPKAAQV